MNEIGSLLLGAGIFITSVMSVVNFFVSRSNAKDIHELAVNTNSIKDALVKVTGEAAHAAGKEEGRAEGVIKATDLAAGVLKAMDKGETK